jgi:hypothetical protein
MATSELQVLPENFNVSSETPEDGRFVVPETLSLGREPAHLESALPPELARRVVAQMVSLARPASVRFTVEGAGVSASLELPLRVEKRARATRLSTTKGAEGIEFVLEFGTDGKGRLEFNVRYAGLPLDKAILYARFLNALYSPEGALYMASSEQSEEKFELFRLPLPLDGSRKGDAEDRVRLLEALVEVREATGVEFVHPAEMEEEDLRNLNHVLKAIRGGWVALPVTDFTTPMNRDGVKNVLGLTAQEGEVLRALAMTAEWERVEVFGAWVDLGPSIRYVYGARLVTPRSEMERWLASGPADGSFEIRWEPVDGARVHVFYNEWPKPSLAAIREDIMAFEEVSGKSSEEFHRAWDAGEEWARGIEGGDVWINVLDAERHLLRQTD